MSAPKQHPLDEAAYTAALREFARRLASGEFANDEPPDLPETVPLPQQAGDDVVAFVYGPDTPPLPDPES